MISIEILLGLMFSAGLPVVTHVTKSMPWILFCAMTFSWLEHSLDIHNAGSVDLLSVSLTSIGNSFDGRHGYLNNLVLREMPVVIAIEFEDTRILVADLNIWHCYDPGQASLDTKERGCHQ